MSNQEFKNFVLRKLNNEKSIKLVLKVIPNSSKTEVCDRMADESWKMKVKAAPEKGKANIELISFLNKLFEKQVEIKIITGKSSRIKLISLIRKIKNK